MTAALLDQGNRRCAVLSRAPQYTNQTYWLADRFPDSEMIERLKKGFSIQFVY